MRHVVKHDERASVGGSEIEQSKKVEDSGVAGNRGSVSGDSRGVRDNRPGGVRRPEETSGRLKKAVGLGDKVAVSFPYDPVLISAIKQLSGRRWDADGKRWICEPSAQLKGLLTEHSFVLDDFATRMLAEALPTDVVSQRGAVLILKAGYKPDLVAKIREIPSRRWDKTLKTWSFSIVAITQLEKLAKEFGLKWDVSDGSVEEGDAVQVSNGWLSVRFSADRDVQETIAELYGVRFDAATMRWLVPEAYAPEVVLAAKRFGWTCDEHSQKVFARYGREIELYELSRSQEASLEIPGLGIKLMPFQQAGVMYVLKALGAVEVGEGRWERRTPTPQGSHD